VNACAVDAEMKHLRHAVFGAARKAANALCRIVEREMPGVSA
jgi:hypothetical protein